MSEATLADALSFYLEYLLDIGETELYIGSRTVNVEGKENKPPSKAELLSILAEEIRDCTKCKLHSTRTNVVVGAGNPDAKVMFVGEAPGEEEDRQGIPFVGRAGRLLTSALEEVGWSRDDVYIANVLKCRPPKNRPPLPNEMSACLPYLIRQIDIIQPEVIVALGRVAGQAFMKKSISISRFRGKFANFRGRRVFFMYHPSYLLRNPSAMREFNTDFRGLWERYGEERNKGR